MAQPTNNEIAIESKINTEISLKSYIFSEIKLESIMKLFQLA